MFRLLAVDDEKIVIDAVSFIVEKNFFGEIVFEGARSGREAIEKSETFNPDIILIDIRMPGINGIEAIKEIKLRRPNTIFIIISAYEQFEFAKDALKIGVSDYILKPIIKDDLVASIKKSIDAIKEKNRKKKLELEEIEKYQQLLPFLEHGFIYSLLMNDSYITDSDKYRELFGLTEEGGYIMLLQGEALQEDIPLGEELPFYQAFRDILKYKCKCLIGPSMIDRIVAFISTDFKLEYSGDNGSYEIASYVSDKLSSYKDKYKFNIGIGSYKKLENISVSYDEALRALHYFKNKGIVNIKDILIGENASTEYPKDQESILIEMILQSNKDGALDAFRNIYQWAKTNYENSYTLGKLKLMELMVIIYRSTYDFGVKYEAENYLFEIYNINDYILLEAWCREKIISLVKNIQDMQEKKINKIIILAKAFISANYTNEIALEDVSKSVSVSPHYLSKLFKEETGENFIDYLTRTRIYKAKELMKLGNLSIKEICFKIGYSDPNYFSFLFKKVEKITPSEYIRNL